MKCPFCESDMVETEIEIKHAELIIKTVREPTEEALERDKKWDMKLTVSKYCNNCEFLAFFAC